MKPPTMVGMLGMVVALVLYSIGVWSAFRGKKFTQRSVMFILAGVVFDVIGTGGMFVAAGNQFLFDPIMEAVHTWSAFIAFFGMLAVGVAGTWAVQKNKEAFVAKLSKWALAPWVLWVVVFIMGGILSGMRARSGA